MLKIIWHLILSTVIATACVFLVWSLPTAVNKPPINQSETQKAQQADHKDFAFSFGLVWRKIGTFIHENKDDINALATVVIAIFTTVLGVFTISLSKSTRIAADTSREALTKLERAFVYNKGLEWKAYVNSVRKDRGWVFTAEWHNGGTTQAKHFLTHISWDTWLWFDGD
jgi:hypothetical protein